MHANLTLIYLIVRYIRRVSVCDFSISYSQAHMYSVECQYARQLDFSISYSQAHMYSVECQYARQLDFNISYSQVHMYSVECQYARQLDFNYPIVRYMYSVVSVTPT